MSYITKLAFQIFTLMTISHIQQSGVTMDGSPRPKPPSEECQDFEEIQRGLPKFFSGCGFFTQVHLLLFFSRIND